MNMNTIKKVIALVILVIILLFALQWKNGVRKNNEVRLVADSVITGYFDELKVDPLTEKSVLISWKSATSTQIEFKYATSTNAETKMLVKDDTFRTAHTIELNHLDPKTTYYFSIGARTVDNNAAGIEGEFVTKK